MSKSEKFKKITHVRLPFDQRNSDPKQNYGIHGLDVWFILQGPLGAVQYGVTFPVYLPHIDIEYPAKFPDWNEGKRIRGFDVGYHAPKPMYEGQAAMECQLLEGGQCYYDGSSLRAGGWTTEIFSVRGEPPEKLLWTKLEEEYQNRFETESHEE